MSDTRATGTATGTAQAVLAALLEARTGQALGAGRAWRIETALRPVLRDREPDTLDALVLDLLDGRHPGLAEQVTELLLNGETSFFREPALFTAAAQAMAIPAAGGGAGRPRIWCAGCSTGQEPLSLAMLFAESGRGMPEIVATDWSETAVSRARTGRYTQFEIQRGLSAARMIRWFDETGTGDWTAKPELLRAVQFRRANLVADPAPAGQFDVIFCRNVLFYFTPAARRQVLVRLAGATRPGGLLVLGAGETAIGHSDAFVPSVRVRGLYEPAPRPWPLRGAVPATGAVEAAAG